MVATPTRAGAQLNTRNFVQAQAQTARTVLRKQSPILSVRKLSMGLVRLLTGEFLFMGVGDGGNDKEEIQMACDTMSLVSTLILSVTYDPLMRAADTALLLDFAVFQGFGTVYLWVAHFLACVCLWVTIAALVAGAILNSMPTQFETTYFLHIASLEIRVPFVGFQLIVVIIVIIIVTEVTLRALQVVTKAQSFFNARAAAVAASASLNATLNATLEDAGVLDVVRRQLIARSGGASSSVAGPPGAVSSGSGGFTLSDEAATHRYYLTMILLNAFIATVLLGVWAMLMVSKQAHTRMVFGGASSPAARAERKSGMAVAVGVPWLAQPTKAELVAHLDAYFDEYASPTDSLGNAIAFDHCLAFVLWRERQRGHGDLSDTSRQGLERLFSARHDKLIEALYGDDDEEVEDTAPGASGHEDAGDDEGVGVVKQI